MNRAHHRLTGLALGLLLLIAASGARPSTSLGGEFHFVIHDLEGEGAAWLPREVVIHKSTDLDGGLIFILENPTPRTHVFEAPGLFDCGGTRGLDREAVTGLCDARGDRAGPGQHRTVTP